MTLSTNSRQTILVVDDTPENIDILNDILKDDYHVKATLSGEKALQIASSTSPPDLILLDVMMPKMDGYEVCRHLKSSHTTSHIPVIFVTAKSDIDDEAKGFALGAVDYITKPIHPLAIQARVRAQLMLSEQNKRLESLVQQRTSELSKSRLELIRRLGLAAEYKDNETGMHVMRMSHYCHEIGLSAGLSQEEAETLLQVAPMHDIGKIGIPDNILLKPGKLTPKEWTVMKSHTIIGAKIIGEHTSSLLKQARIVCLSHHEKWDGSGYPLGISGEEIPFVGRIAAIADVFDALTSERPYKKAWSVEQALDEIQSSKNKHFDPSLVDVFLELTPRILEIKDRFPNSGDYHESNMEVLAATNEG